MAKQFVATALLSLGLTAVAAWAQPVVLIDGNATLLIAPQDDRGVLDFRIDGIQQLKRHWIYYRVGNTGPELPLNRLQFLGTLQDTPNAAQLLFDAPGQFGLTVYYELLGGASGGGSLGTIANLGLNVTVDNFSGVPLDFHLFMHFDFDLAGQATNDTALHFEPNVWAQRTPDIGTSLNAVTVGAGAARNWPKHWEFGLVPTVLDKLIDSQPTTLADSANSVGPADVETAFQWDEIIGGIGGSSQFNWLLFVSAPCRNASPTLDPLQNLTLTANAGPQTVALNHITSGASNELQLLLVTATSSNPALVPHPVVDYTLGLSEGSLTFASLPNASGTATLEVTVDDLGCNNNLLTRAFTVEITLLDLPPAIAVLGPLVLNRQTGLFEQVVTVTNASSFSRDAVQLTTSNALPAGVRLWNASGTNAGLPYVQHNRPLLPGGTVDFHLEYYLTNRLQVASLTNGQGIFDPGYRALVAPPNDLNPVGTESTPVPSIQLRDGSILVEFSSLSNRSYYIQYSTAPTGPTWQTAQPAIPGNGSRVQWIDRGPPKTDSAAAARFYRLMVLP